MTRIALFGAAAMFAAVVLTGCSDVEEALNEGADTRCSDFIEQGADEQRQTITKALKQQTGDDGEPLGTTVDATILSVNLLCQLQGNRDTPIKNADLLGGIAPR